MEFYAENYQASFEYRHPSSDQWLEWVDYQVLEHMIQDRIMYFGGHLDQSLPLVELSYNKSYHSNI